MTQKIKNKKIWIDLDNSPHVAFFEPIIDELEKRDYTVVISVRDCFQVVGMVKQTRMKYHIIGKHFGKNKLLKLIGLFIRGFQLLPLALKEKPALAVSHGSRSQSLVCNILGINSIYMYDYEFSTEPFFTKSKWNIAPEIVVKNTSLFKRQKAYPGIKEDVYVPNFIPDNSIRKELGVKDSEIMVTIRPPATEAHYHNPQSENLFNEIITMLNGNTSVRMVILPRNDKQKNHIENQWQQLFENRKIIIPSDVINGLNLIWFSDFVISGGGTMNREAVALGVPVYSIFRGRIGTLDHYLAEQGRLTLVQSVDEIKKIVVSKRKRPAKPRSSSPETLNSIIDSIEEIAEKSN